MKKHLHKGIALLCSAAIAAGMLVGCSSGSSSAAAPGSASSASASVSNSESGPLFSEPVTLSMLTPSHASWPFQEDWYVVDLIKEYTNVDLKVTAVDTSGFDEKLNLTMASGELPDLMFLIGNKAVQQYGSQGAFVNILDYIDQMPNFKAWYEKNTAHALNYMSADGGLYQFPQQGVTETNRRGWLYRADIFEELGLEAPTTQDEFYDVLVKLKEAYPNSYPLAFRSFSLCGYSVVPIDETMLFFANGSLRLHTGSDLSVTCGSGYEAVDTSSYPNAFEAQWADFISGVRAGRILYCDGTYGASIVRTIELLYH